MSRVVRVTVTPQDDIKAGQYNIYRLLIGDTVLLEQISYIGPNEVIGALQRKGITLNIDDKVIVRPLPPVPQTAQPLQPSLHTLLKLPI